MRSDRSIPPTQFGSFRTGFSPPQRLSIGVRAAGCETRGDAAYERSGEESEVVAE
jgi:hypothetical protein